jgi:hypothetical protein
MESELVAYDRQELAGDEKFLDLLDETLKDSTRTGLNGSPSSTFVSVLASWHLLHNLNFCARRC